MSAIPSLSRFYSGRVNVPYNLTTSTTALLQSYLFNFIGHLLNTASGGTTSTQARDANALWVCRGSSDGVTAGMDGVNRITDPTKLALANDGTAHGWFCARNTALGYDILIDVNSTDARFARISACEVASTWSGGSTTHGPTATGTNEFQLGSTTAPTGTAGNAQVLSDQTLNGNNFTHFVTTVDGSFFFFATRQGNGQPIHGHMLQKTVNSLTGVTDTRNLFLLYSFNGLAWDMSDMCQTAARTAGRITTGTNTLGSRAGPFANSSLAANGQAQTWWTPAAGAAQDAATGNFLVWPLHIGHTANQSAYRGQIPDFYMITGGAQGLSYPSVAAQTHMLIGTSLQPMPLPCVPTF